MSAPMTTDSGQQATLSLRERRTRRHDLLALAALGMIIGLACRGHFAMPHADFPEFVDSGHALWNGELPATLKRAPLYPVLVVGLAKLVPAAVPEVTSAEWLNALLLPINGLLVYVIGRRWFGWAARWVAAWFLLLPIGMYCTAHLLLEPLLVALMLTTVCLAQRNRAWAYFAAAAATITRYDVAGLILGLAIADLVRRRGWGRTLLFTVLALLPLAGWLTLTALSWNVPQPDHYLQQVAEQPAFDLWWSLDITRRCAFEIDLVELPIWLDALETWLAAAITWIPPAAAAVGLWSWTRTRDRGGLVVTGMLFGYVAVHAVYAFRMDRFGYPPAALLVLMCGRGIAEAAALLRRAPISRSTWAVLAGLLGALAALVLLERTWGLGLALDGGGPLARRMGLPVLVAVVLVWAAALRRPRVAQVTLLLTSVAVTIAQVRAASVTLAAGDEMKNQILAAQWIRENTAPDERLLAANPGLFRLYVSREPADRFIGYEAIAATNWEALVSECRQRGIAFIIWHNQLGGLHAAYYGDRLGLERFEPLRLPELAQGVEVAYRPPGDLEVVIARVLPDSPPVEQSPPP